MILSKKLKTFEDFSTQLSSSQPLLKGLFTINSPGTRRWDTKSGRVGLSR